MPTTIPSCVASNPANRMTFSYALKIYAINQRLAYGTHPRKKGTVKECRQQLPSRAGGQMTVMVLDELNPVSCTGKHGQVYFVISPST